MLAYTVHELCSLNRGGDVNRPGRSVRKQLFSAGLWAPPRDRLRCAAAAAAVQAAHVAAAAPARDLSAAAPVDPVADSRPSRPAAVSPQVRCLLSLATWNVCSLSNKFTSVAELIVDRRLDLLAVTETWHGDSDDVALRRSAPPGYRVIDVARPRSSPHEQPHGGVALIFRDHFVAKKLDIVVDLKSFEYACVSLSTPQGPVAVTVVYRRPGPVTAAFCGEFTSLLESLATFNSQLVITGDLNVHLDDPQSDDANRMSELLASFGLVQHVKESTHRHGHTLDVVITRADYPVADVAVDPPSLSDHGVVTCSLPSPCPARPALVSRLARGWKNLDRAAFRAALQSSPLCCDPGSRVDMSAAELFQLYDTTLRAVVDRFVPLRRVTSCHRLTAPWFDADCRQFRRRVRFRERWYRRTKDPDDRRAWITAEREKHNMFREKENQYWEATVAANSRNPRKLWSSVSTLLGKSVEPLSAPSTFSAADFLRFLEDKVDGVRSATATAPPPDFSHTECTFGAFKPVDDQFVERLIRASPAKSCDLDPLPTCILKEFLDVLLPFLTRMCNASITEGCLPSSQKEAIVIPALKKHGLDPSEMKNYRPISNLSFASKLVEKVVFSQVTAYLAQNDLWPKLQSGFRQFHSTESAVLKVLSDIFSAIDQGNVALLALLDVSAAFDTVDHEILLQRLSTSYGISGLAHDWFKSFVTGRLQTVRLGATCSDSVPVRSGVPQGSVLGPLLYVLYTAGIIPLVESLHSNVHLYADDAQLYEYCRPVDSVALSQRVLATVDAVSAWMASNRLRLNLDKTQFLWLGSKEQLAKLDKQQLAAILPALVESTSARDLGVILDEQLTFKQHVSKLSQSCYFQLRRLRSIRRSLSPALLNTLVHAFVCSRLDFCNSSFCGSSVAVLDRMQSILNAAARLVLGLRKFDHISVAMRDTLHWLPVRQRIDFKVCLLVRNCLNGAAPPYLSEFCVPVSTVGYRQHLRSAAHGDLKLPKVHRERYGRRGFYISGPRLWNQLPRDIRQQAANLTTFKRALKTHYFRQQTNQRF